MRYTSRADSTLMRRRALDPSVILRRRGYALGALTDITGVTSGNTTKAVTSGISAGITAGAAIGSVVPVPILGTAIGALVGGAIGAIGAAFNRQDQEVQNFNQAQAIATANGPSAVLNISNKYLVLAGLFDLDASQIKGNIPFYKKYGHENELKFVTDMCQQIQAAANSGVITNNDTPASVYSKVILPWINNMGFGTFADSNAAMIGYILQGMIAEYCAGVFTQRWYARGGDMPFGNLPAFTLPQATQPAQPQTTASPTPSPVATTNTSTGSQPSELSQYLAGRVPTTGQAINYAKSLSGQFLALPQQCIFQNVWTDNGAWIFTVGSGSQLMFLDASGTAQTWPPAAPVTATTTTTAPVQSATPQVNQDTSAASATDSSGNVIQTQYIPASSVSTLPAPVTSSALAPVTSSFSNTELLGGLALVAGLFFLLSQKHAR